MIIHKDKDTLKILTLPPKTGSRSITKSMEGLSFLARHEPICSHHLSARLASLKGNFKKVLFYSMTRSPFSWYESFYNHMRRQDFLINKVYGHTDKTSFKEALYDYIFGPSSLEVVHKYMHLIEEEIKEDQKKYNLQSKKKGVMFWDASDYSNFIKMSIYRGIDDPLKIKITPFFLQRKWNMGLFATTMMISNIDDPFNLNIFSFSEVEEPPFNDDVRYILMGDYTELRAQGFPVNMQIYLQREGMGGYEPEKWDKEMFSWVEKYDVPTWTKIKQNMR